MPSAYDAERIAVLNFLRCAHGRREARVPHRAETPTNLEECEPIELWIIGNAGNRQTSGGKMQTIGRHAIRVVRPSGPHPQVVHHVRTYGPSMSDGESVGIVVRIPPPVATIGEPG